MSYSSGGRLRPWALTAALTGLLVAAGCGSGTSNSAATSQESRYCQAWADTVSAFSSYRDVDVINGGLNSVRGYVDRLNTAVGTLAGAADQQLKPKVDDFEAALRNLTTTITSTALPVDRRAQVRAAANAVNAKWSEISAASPACPNMSVSTAR